MEPNGVSKGWIYSPRLLAALQVAAQLHATQVRKGTQVPYLAHLLGTCSIAMEHGADEDQAIAALLHDAIEDVEPTEVARTAVSSFGQEVLRIVEACTDADEHPKPDWRPRKERYIGHLAGADRAVLLVSAADKLHNARAIVADLRTVGPALWGRFTAGRDGQLWYYRALTDAYRSNPAHVPELVAELDRTLTEMERLGAAPVEAPPVPGVVLELIGNHAGPALRPVAIAFAERLAAIPGVELRIQRSKDYPSYYQVRYEDQTWVIAYVQPRHSHMSVLYRLGNNHDTRGLPTTRFTGPRVRLSQMDQLPTAITLVHEAIKNAGG